MANKSFASLRLINHLLVLLQLLACISLIVIRILFNEYFDVEELLRAGSLNMRSMLLITAFVNLIVPFFGACVIDSKLRPYMRVFLIYDTFTVVINVLALLFVKKMYISIFEKGFSSAITRDQGNKMYIQTVYDCSDVGDVTCIELFKGYLVRLEQYYVIVVGCLLFLNISMWILVRLALSMDIKDKKAKPPKMVSQKVGFSTGSLRRKKLVTENGSPTSSVIENLNR